MLSGRLAHQGVELLRVERLRAVAERGLGVVVDLDDQAVRAGADGCLGQGGHQRVNPSGMAGVHNNGKMAHLLHQRNRGDVQCIAGGCLKGADAALAEDDIGVPRSQDVFRAHEEFLQRVGEAPLEQDGLFYLAQLL